MSDTGVRGSGGGIGDAGGSLHGSVDVGHAVLVQGFGGHFRDFFWAGQRMAGFDVVGDLVYGGDHAGGKRLGLGGRVSHAWGGG